MGVSAKSRSIIWGLAAGRCQFPGCNKSLIGDLIAGNDHMNAGYVAHIVAETEGGPRGDPVRSPLLTDDPANLMLLCDPHHRLIDRDEVDDYPEERLLAIKRQCERRIELATDVAPDRASHILRFAATIGMNEGVISLPNCKEAMTESHYPASREPIDLSMSGLSLADSDPDYFPLHAKNLRRQFDAKVRGRLESQEIRHLSVFALAPIPMLIELGRLLSDIKPASAYQLHREPPGWKWAKDAPTLKFKQRAPRSAAGPIALKLSVSATVSDDRIHAALGDEAAIWSIDVESPHNDCIRSPEDLVELRKILRRVLNDIKSRHGEQAAINLFPATPVSVAVELGRVWMPKADLPLRIYDQSRQEGGFVHRLTIV